MTWYINAARMVSVTISALFCNLFDNLNKLINANIATDCILITNLTYKIIATCIAIGVIYIIFKDTVSVVAKVGNWMLNITKKIAIAEMKNNDKIDFEKI